MPKTHHRPAAAIALAGLLALSACTGQTPEPSQSPEPAAETQYRPEVGAAAKAGAEWVKGKLVQGSYLESSATGTPLKDVGLTIDALWALAAAGDLETANKVAAWAGSETAVEDYGSGAEGMSYASRLAKMGLALNTEGVTFPATAAAAKDTLAERLLALLDDKGRFVDKAQADTSSPYGQSLAVLFLAKQGKLEGLEPDPVGYLVDATCEDGSWPFQFEMPEPCSGDVDTTAMAVQVLAAVGGQDEAVAKGIEWLVQAQDTKAKLWNGWEGLSVNSSAMAVLALVRSNQPGAAQAESDAWEAIAHLQLKDGGFPVGPDKKVAAKADLMATLQAVPAMAETNLAALVGFTATK